MPRAAKTHINWDDLDIDAMKLRSNCIEKAHARLKGLQLSLLTEIEGEAEDRLHFYFADP